MSYAIAAGRPFDAAVTRATHAPDHIGSLACLSINPKAEGGRWPVVFVPRAPSASRDEWICDAEKELERGVNRIVLLESGGQYAGGERTLEVTGIAKARAATHLPIVVDVPMIAGRARYAVAIASAAIAAGANGVIVRAWVGGPEVVPRVPATLSWDKAVQLAERLRSIGEALQE